MRHHRIPVRRGSGVRGCNIGTIGNPGNEKVRRTLCFVVFVAGSLTILGLLARSDLSARQGVTVLITSDQWSVVIDPSTLSASGVFPDGSQLPISLGRPDLGPAANLQSAPNRATWDLPLAKLRFAAHMEHDRFFIEATSSQPGKLTWPVVAPDERLRGILLPLGEGFYIPVREPLWQDFALQQSPIHTMETLSMPLWGIDYGNRSLTYILMNPFDNELTLERQGTGLGLRLTHAFQNNYPEMRHGMMVVPGNSSPIEPARIFRKWLMETGRFVTLTQKLKNVPELERLFGAAHVYTWPGGSKDVDGGGISPTMMDRLKDAGMDRLWLGVSDVDMLRSMPETVSAAKRAGYLFGPYDSYHSIHPPDAKETWPTAQFDRELFDKGAIVRSDGRRDQGFQGVGSHLSSIAAEPYVRRRVGAWMKEFGFNSYFVDCDATGELFDNYSPSYPATKELDMRKRLERMAWIRDTYRLVLGSEVGAWFAAADIHFGHGMMTPVFGYRDPLLRDPKSPYFMGRWYPAGRPTRFFTHTLLPKKYTDIYFDPRYRLPLYQAAFHDAIITTHHWEYPSWKFSNVQGVNELLELLYAVPPLYHLDLQELVRQKDEMQRHHAFFSPNYRKLATIPLTEYSWLTPDRLVQRTGFGEEASVVVNFGTRQYVYEGHAVPPSGVLLIWEKTGQTITYQSQHAGASLKP
jgi:hypothetical protein